MPNMIVVRVPDTTENKRLIAGLLGAPGVVIESCNQETERNGRKYYSLHEAAEYLGVNYHTMRKWAVVDNFIPYERPSGKANGIIRFSVAVLDDFASGRLKKARRTRGGRIKILD